MIALLFSSLLIYSASACAEDKIKYDIPEQSLNNALMKFAVASRLELIFSADLVRGLQNPPVTGEFTKEQALRQLLENSDFKFNFLDNHTVTLHRADKPEKPIFAEPVTLDNVIVNGDGRQSAALQLNQDKSLRYTVKQSVSATKTATPLRNIPQSVQILPRALLDDQQSTTASESLLNVSGVTPRNVLFTNAGEGTYIRGFRAEQLTDGFTQYYNTGDRESTVNIQSIEVLKGANAVLYGGGAGAPAGGVINIISKLPQPQTFGEAGFKVGRYDFYQPYFDWNQPANQRLWLRVTGEYTSSGSNIADIDTTRFNINPALSFNTDHTVFTLQGKISRWRQPEYQGLPATGAIAGSFRIAPQTFLGPADITPSYSDTDAVWASVEHQHNQTWSWNLKTRFANSSVDEFAQVIIGAGPSFIAEQPLLPPSTWGLANAELFQRQKDLSIAANALAKFPVGDSQNQILFGVDHGILKDNGFVHSNFTNSPVNLVNPQFPVYVRPEPATDDQFVTNTTDGTYLQWQSDAYQRLHTLLSLRLGSIQVDYHSRGVNSQTASLALLPRFGTVIDITDSLSLFGGYSQGMRGQPFINFTREPQPEISQQLESGVKLDWRRCLTGQLAVYQIDRDHVAATSGNGQLLAVGRQRSQGVELDLNWEPWAGINILGNYAHTYAVFLSSQYALAGNHIQQIPADSSRLWLNYRFQQAVLAGWSIGGGVYLNSGAYLGSDNLYKAPGYHSFDLALAYENSRFKVAATVKNLSNEQYFIPFGYFGSGTTGGGRVAPAAASALYLSAALKF